MRKTIKSLESSISELKTEISELDKVVAQSRVKHVNDDREICELRRRNRELMELAKAERKEVMWFRNRMVETKVAMKKLRDRIAYVVDCVGGRPSGDCHPMGRKLSIDVGAILVYAVDMPASEVQLLVTLENIEAHKLVRDAREKGLPSLDVFDRDADINPQEAKP